MKWGNIFRIFQVTKYTAGIVSPPMQKRNTNKWTCLPFCFEFICFSSASVAAAVTSNVKSSRKT